MMDARALRMMPMKGWYLLAVKTVKSRYSTSTMALSSNPYAKQWAKRVLDQSPIRNSVLSKFSTSTNVIGSISSRKGRK